jgi:hypothetical protein
MLGPDKGFDTNKYLVVCANVLGSCYGTCGPTTINPMTGQPYGGDFPLVTVRDSVTLHSRLIAEVRGPQIWVLFGVAGGVGGVGALPNPPRTRPVRAGSGPMWRGGGGSSHAWAESAAGRLAQFIGAREGH